MYQLYYMELVYFFTDAEVVYMMKPPVKVKEGNLAVLK